MDLALIKTANDCNIPVWIDHDDDFTCIPRDNPNWAGFAEKKTQDTFKECCARATVATVTTTALAEKLKPLTSNVCVIPNAWDNYSFGDMAPINKRSPVIAWRGSSTHQNDLLHYREEIVQLAETFPDFEWHFFGYYPFFLTDKMKHKFHRFTSLHRFMTLFKNVAPSVTIVPLVDNPFNRAKSSIAWLESTYAGAVTVAPNFEGWKVPGVFNYSNKESFHQQCQIAIASVTGEVNEHTKKSAEYIRQSLSLSIINTLRAELIRILLRRTPE